MVWFKKTSTTKLRNLMLGEHNGKSIAIRNKEYSAFEIKEAFRLWWNREGHTLFSDHLWFSEFGVNPFPKTKNATRSGLTKKQEQELFKKYVQEAEVLGKELSKKCSNVLKRNRNEGKLIEKLEIEFPIEDSLLNDNEKEQLAATMSQLTNDEKAEMEKDEEFFVQLQKLQFVPETEEKYEYFNGIYVDTTKKKAAPQCGLANLFLDLFE